MGKTRSVIRKFAFALKRHKLTSLIGLVIVAGIVVGLVLLLSSGKKPVQQIASNPIAKKYNSQLASLKAQVNKNPNSAVDIENYAVALYATGNTQAAQQQYLKATQLDNKNATLQNNLGNTYRDEGNYSAAVTAYNKAIELNPKLINSYTNLANVQLYSLNKPGDAISTYIKGLKALPNNSQLQILLALAYEKEGDTASAKQTLQAAQAANPNNQVIKQNLASLK